MYVDYIFGYSDDMYEVLWKDRDVKQNGVLPVEVYSY